MTSPWLNRAEAAEYLRVSYDTVVRLEVPYQEQPVPGRIRTVIIQIRGLNRMRVLRADVLAILAQPTGEAIDAPDPNTLTLCPT